MERCTTSTVCEWVCLGMAGPAVFLPAPAVEAPPEDVKLFDARRLTLHQPASNDVSALASTHTFQHTKTYDFYACHCSHGICNLQQTYHDQDLLCVLVGCRATALYMFDW